MFLVVPFDLSSTYKLNLADLNGNLSLTRTTEISSRQSLNCQTAAKDSKKSFILPKGKLSEVHDKKY